MFRKPTFWIVLVLLAAVSTWFGIANFSRAFPIVSLDITMDRASALASARDLEAKHHFGPGGFRQAASFRGDQEVQNFVELEAGGTAAFHEMFASGRYQPFQWYVRHFREGEARETKLYFTPRGEPYGFVVKLPEKEVGAALEADQAQAIAEREAGEWKVDLATFALVEKSRDVRPGGRVDHTFVYERPDVKIGDGRYRLRLVVGGDRLTTLQHFVKVPEAFGRRFEEMRSANNGISIISVVGLVLVYLIGGCGVGLFILGRERWIIWRTPVIWGVFVAFLQLLEGINQWPLTWLDYDTAVSSGGFVAQQVGMQLLTFVGYAFLFSVSFMAAESLTRRAFPERLQLWKLWSPNVSASKTMLGQTAAGYLLVAVFFGYEVLFYFLASRGLGWWMPSDTLVQPDVLASHQPWFSAIAVSTQAGFWEEAMFRAVPLACAALLGQRFGRRGWWITGTLILQAVIFGSGHAGYANQPAYARVVELVVPSLMFGGLYLVFGLWPGIVLHFGYDVAMFAIPIFVTSAPGAWADRMMVILLVLVPLWIVIGGRRRAGAWTEAAAGARNAAWQPPPKETAVKEATVAPSSVHPLVVRGLPIAGVIGLAAWAFFAHFTYDAPPLDVGRGSAEQTARRALAERGVTLDSRWRALPELDGSPTEPHNFVWRTAGREAYDRLLGQFMAPPRWTVRFARFTGDVAERAEEYQVMVGAGGKVTGVRHLLPEDRAVPSMTEADARALALQTLRERFNFEPAMLKEVEAKPSKLKSRTDWLFTFTVRTEPPLKEGETRATVSIAGNEVNAAGRFVFIPEEWARAERDRQTLPGMINMACIALIALAVVGGIIFGIVNWVRRCFSLRTFLVLAPVLWVVSLAARFNQWPTLTAAFSTAQPYELQVVIVIVGLVIGMTALALGLAVLGGYVTRARQQPLLTPVDRLTTGVSVALVAAGLGAAVTRLAPSFEPSWPNYAPLASYVPWAAPPLGAVSELIVPVLAGWFFIGLVDGLTAGWTRRKALGAAAVLVLGLAVAGLAGTESLPWWAAAGILTGTFGLAAYVFVFRAAPDVLAVAMAATFSLGAIRAAWSGAYPGVAMAQGLRAVVLWAAAWLLLSLWKASAGQQAPAPATPAAQG
jgi:hypothetical protein